MNLTVKVNGNVNRYNEDDLQLRKKRQLNTDDQYRAVNIQVYVRGSENSTIYAGKSVSQLWYMYVCPDPVYNAY